MIAAVFAYATGPGLVLASAMVVASVVAIAATKSLPPPRRPGAAGGFDVTPEMVAEAMPSYMVDHHVLAAELAGGDDDRCPECGGAGWIGCGARWHDDQAPERPGFVHNVVAHPLLWLCPKLGNWLHARSEPVVPVRVVTVRRVPGGHWWCRMRWHYAAEWPAHPSGSCGVGGWSWSWLGAQVAARLARRPPVVWSGR